MSALLDSQGRVFGRVNLIDALCVVFVLGLVPVAYASLLLFRPARPQIRSIERSEVNKEELRIANGKLIRLKVKVRGEHLTPNLRAMIDDVQAIGFTYESPASADVIVGADVPLGTHDLILYDGAQEVARARQAVKIDVPLGARMRVVGTLVQLDGETAKSLRAGQRFEVNGAPAAEFVTLGEIEPDRQRLRVADGYVETPIEGSWRRPVIMTVHCDPDPDTAVCHLGADTLGDPNRNTITVPGAPQTLRVLIDDVVPATPPVPATVRVRASAAPDLIGKIKPGDRDMRGLAIDDRTASVVAVHPLSAAGGVELVLRLGLDRASDGWRYKSAAVAPGSPLSLITDRYAVQGLVVDAVIDEH